MVVVPGFPQINAVEERIGGWEARKRYAEPVGKKIYGWFVVVVCLMRLLTYQVLCTW